MIEGKTWTDTDGREPVFVHSMDYDAAGTDRMDVMDEVDGHRKHRQINLTVALEKTCLSEASMAPH